MGDVQSLIHKLGVSLKGCSCLINRLLLVLENMSSHWHHLITTLQAVFHMRSFNKIGSVRVKSIILIFGSSRVIS